MFAALANPHRFMAFSRWAAPLCGLAALALIAPGLWLGFAAPPDYQQGTTVRIMFIHVPAAITAEWAYACLGGASFFALIFRPALADAAARAVAPLGAAFTLLALVTGSLWGRPMWGTWWVWDARLTSVLVLFFLYLGYIALANAFDDPGRGGRAASVLALVGGVNLPIIQFSVDWWNTLHQAGSVFRIGGPTIDKSMLVPLLVMACGYLLLFSTLLLVRMRTALNERQARGLQLAAAPVAR